MMLGAATSEMAVGRSVASSYHLQRAGSAIICNCASTCIMSPAIVIVLYLYHVPRNRHRSHHQSPEAQDLVQMQCLSQRQDDRNRQDRWSRLVDVAEHGGPFIYHPVVLGVHVHNQQVLHPDDVDSSRSYSRRALTFPHSKPTACPLPMRRGPRLILRSG